MWDTRYRPQVFDEVLGQEGSVRVLQSRLMKDEAFNTSYIFAGGHGSGKTTLARILARAMLCLQRREDGNPCNACDHCLACLNETMVAFTELDAASQGTTADMRKVVEHLAYDVPGVAKRIYLLDEAHRMSRDAQDVLLKPIEDKRVVVLFCTTEYGKIRDTIKSRCETYEIRKIQKEEILERVRMILEREHVEFEDDAVLTVIDYARGHVRDVLNKLEMIAQLGAITVDAVRERLDLGMVSLYYDMLLALGDAATVIQLVEAACDRVGAPQVGAGIAEAAMNAYRQANKVYTDYSQVDRDRAARVYERFGTDVVNVARYFLSLGAYASRVDVVCAAVAFGTAAATTTAPRVLEPPVVFLPAPIAPEHVQPATPALPAVTTVAPAAAVVATAALVKTTTTPPAPAPTPTGLARPGKLYLDGNVPRNRTDEAGMNAPRGKGVGPAFAATQASKPKAVNRPSFEEHPGAVNAEQFRAIFSETLGRISNVK